MRAAVTWAAVACVLLTGGASRAFAPAGSALDDTAAAAGHEVTEMLAGRSARPDIAVSVRVDAGPRAAAVANDLGGRIVHELGALGAGKGVVVADVDAAALRKAGFGMWIEAELRIDGKNGQVGVRLLLRRFAPSWRELISQPTSGWVRVVTMSWPLDAELRRGLGMPAVGPRKLGRARRLELDLGAPVLALAAADLDGDGVAELLALTPDEVVVLEARKSALLPRQRVALGGDAPAQRPREPFGSMVAVDLDHDGRPELVATSSEHDKGVRLAWRRGALVADGTFYDYPVCGFPYDPGPVDVGAVQLFPGTSTINGGSWWLERGPKPYARDITELPQRMVAMACLEQANKYWFGCVEPDGTFSLDIESKKPRPRLAGVGAAIAFVDLDGDGVPELAASAHRAPGDGDALTIYSLADAKHVDELWKSDPLSGGIVAVTGGDSDGDGAADVIFAARLVGSTRTDVWIVR